MLALSFAPQKDQAQCGDDGSEDCDAYETRWFLKNKEGIKLIGKAAALVDTGDFDKDGRSEMIFALRRYNRDGYALYAPSEKNPWVEFSWNYH